MARRSRDWWCRSRWRGRCWDPVGCLLLFTGCCVYSRGQAGRGGVMVLLADSAACDPPTRPPAQPCACLRAACSKRRRLVLQPALLAGRLKPAACPQHAANAQRRFAAWHAVGALLYGDKLGRKKELLLASGLYGAPRSPALGLTAVLCVPEEAAVLWRWSSRRTPMPGWSLLQGLAFPAHMGSHSVASRSLAAPVRASRTPGP